MAYTNTRAKNTNQAAAQGAGGNERKGPAVLGYVNIGINTNVPGDVRRVESIRLLDNNPLHVVIFNGLNATREEDPTFEVPAGASAKEIKAIEEARKALLAERLAGFLSKLNVTFNPSRTEADSELINF